MILLKLRTFNRLGIRNLFRVLRYKLSLKFGFSAAQNLSDRSITGPFFFATSDDDLKAEHSASVESPLSSPRLKLFGYIDALPTFDKSPSWLLNPLEANDPEATSRLKLTPWWKISDFDSKVGDIKLVWEYSRFNWLPLFAQRYVEGERSLARVIEQWISDWCENNRSYFGPNWKCGQESSIRLINLLLAYRFISETGPAQSGLVDLVSAHLKRIEPTVSYAMAQDNNHGTSEAAALFIGGVWLENQGVGAGKRFAARGRKLLENRVRRLIADDGTFSQYSVNYHRLMLDTLSITEIWRRWYNKPKFPNLFYQKAKAATVWLHSFVDTDHGDTPNIGPNDGAHILNLVDADYRDFRPSVEVAARTFLGLCAYHDNPHCDEQCRWLGLQRPSGSLEPAHSQIFELGGFANLRMSDQLLVMRFPRFRFRPSQADALHVDFWLFGKNILRDAGSYSYNADDESNRYFPGTQAHNTVQFNDRDQMPRLSRFLFGDWLKTRDFRADISSDSNQQVFAAYQDSWGTKHGRGVLLQDRKVVVNDSIDGEFKKAVLRWRLAPDKWVIKENEVSNGQIKIKIVSSVPLERFAIIEGQESRYYLERTDCPVLEMEVSSHARITTEITW